jgi:alkanesulfonate monooxygenase SsuD/methylene tetrahydromethanopterin reductase-like flavin-dependent oxidoreductase (luciferase family)
MRFAHFAHVWGKAGLTPAQRYELLWRELSVADETGFDYGFVVEHHFRPDESWMSAPNLYAAAAGARTRNIRLGGMGHIVPLHHPVRLAEEIAITDQMLGGRVEVGLVPGILPTYFPPFGADYAGRRGVTQEFVRFLKAMYAGTGPVDFAGTHIQAKQLTLAVPPVQRPHPPIWMETRDPDTLAFCAREGLNTGYFILFPRAEAAERYHQFLELWRQAGWAHKPNIAYSTVVYVDETDELAMQRALSHAAQAYRGFFPASDDPTTIRGHQNHHAAMFEQRGEPGAARVVRGLLDPAFLVENDLVLIGSPATVARKLRAWADEGCFNTFFGEFNFGELAEEDVLRSIHLFGTEVIPLLRDHEPF